MTKRSLILVILLVGVMESGSVVADAVTVSVGVRNSPPILSNVQVSIKESIICLAFLVEDPNTLADIKEITVVVYEASGGGLSIQRYVWRGLGTRWSPEPHASFFPPSNLDRQRGFQFVLEIQRKQLGKMIVHISVFDSGKNHVEGECCL